MFTTLTLATLTILLLVLLLLLLSYIYIYIYISTSAARSDRHRAFHCDVDTLSMSLSSILHVSAMHGGGSTRGHPPIRFHFRSI